MKKISLSVLALTACMSMFAQNYEKPTPMASTARFGIKGGVNFSTLKLEQDASSSTSSTTEDLAGFNGGVFANIPMGGVLKFQPELVYSSQGSKFTSTTQIPLSAPVTTTSNKKLGYINLPLLIQAQTTSGFYVETGPQLGYLLTAKNEPTGSNSGSETDIEDNLRKLDFAWAGGIGYLSRVGLGIDARYNFGFRNLYDNENSANANAGQMKNRVIQLGLFWQFGAGK
jgi:hypothetical protein